MLELLVGTVEAIHGAGVIKKSGTAYHLKILRHHVGYMDFLLTQLTWF